MNIIVTLAEEVGVTFSVALSPALYVAYVDSLYVELPFDVISE